MCWLGNRLPCTDSKSSWNPATVNNQVLQCQIAGIHNLYGVESGCAFDNGGRSIGGSGNRDAARRETIQSDDVEAWIATRGQHHRVAGTKCRQDGHVRGGVSAYSFVRWTFRAKCRGNGMGVAPGFGFAVFSVV